MALLAELQARSIPLVSSGAVISHVYRDGARQASLSKLFRAISVSPLDLSLGKQIGQLLANAGTSDVVDAHVALLAQDGDRVLTSDPNDIRDLLKARKVRAQVIEV